MIQFEDGLRPLSEADGTWSAVEEEWTRQCAVNGDDFQEYALDALPVVKDLAANGGANARSYGLFEAGGKCHAVCQANLANLPGYKDPVLRVRHVTLAPEYDYGVLSQEDYARALASLFSEIVAVSYREMVARHVKFHLRSPGDVAFFSTVATTLANLPMFQSVYMRGAWLYLDKKQTADSDTE